MCILVEMVTCTDGPQAMDAYCENIMVQLKGNSLNAHTRLLVQECLGGNAGKIWMRAPVYITNPTTKVA